MKILTERMDAHRSDSHTLERYEATGGYSALRKGFEIGPEAIHAEVKASNIRGRGGANFPAGVKWGFLAPAKPAYLVINGDESEPGTFKDRQLLERDPHQLVEGVILTSYALGHQPCVHLHPGRVPQAGAPRAACRRRRLREGLPRHRHPRQRVRSRGNRPPRWWGLHLRRRVGAAQQPGGSPWRTSHKATIPCSRGALLEADDRQQRRDHLQRAVDRQQWWLDLRGDWAGHVSRDPHDLPVRPHQQARAITRL